MHRLFFRPRSPDGGGASRRGPPPSGDRLKHDPKHEARASPSARLLRFCLAVASIGFASTLTLVVPAILDGQSSVLLLAAVVASTWYCGRWPGLLATVLAGIATTGFLLRSDPRGLGPNDWVELGVFVLVALGMNALAAEWGRAARMLRRSRDDLERRVEVRTSEFLQANEALKAGAEVRRRAQEALSQFAAIEASTEDAVLALRPDGTIISCNAGAERVYGCTTAELVGHSIAVLFPWGASSKLPHMLERLARGETIAPFESVRQP